MKLTGTDSRPKAKSLNIKAAAYRAGKSPSTIARWSQTYGIGRQLHPNAPWRIDALGLEILAAGDGKALEAYRAGEWSAEALQPYLQGWACA